MLELFLKFSENRVLDDIGEEEFKQKLVDESKVNIAIVGGGATGVELTAELYHATEDYLLTVTVKLIILACKSP